MRIPRNESKIRTVYLRITVDRIPKEDQKTERAIGTKEDSKSLNFFLELLILKVNEYKTEIIYSGKPITSENSNIIYIESYSSKLLLLQPKQVNKLAPTIRIHIFFKNF